MLSSATEPRDAVVQVSRELAGTLRVGAEQCLGVVDVASLLERFHRRYPRVEIAFTQAGSHELLAGLRDGDLDAAFVATPDHVGVLPRIVLGQEPVVVLCPPDHPLASRPGVDRDELGGENFIDFTRPGRCASSTTTPSPRGACTAGCGSRSTTCTRCSTWSTAASASRSCRGTSRPSRRPRGWWRSRWRRTAPVSGWSRWSRARASARTRRPRTWRSSWTTPRHRRRAGRLVAYG
jgi:DNA-binding transcriptional LysR family regulator